MNINENKERFINLLSSVDRKGVPELIQFLETTDFFTAPASTNYHLAVEGGLCQHSLNVYNNMMILKEQFFPDMPDDSVKLTALLHDISKIGFYEEYAQNKKVYSKDGSKQDELGRFDWQSVKAYRVMDPMKRDMVCSEHGVNSFLLVNRHVDLTEGETAAIINHHAGMDNGYVLKDLNEGFNRYPAMILLHLADMLAVYSQENPYLIEDNE